MLPLFDGFLTFLHLAIILFNLFGWIPRYTRKAHLISIVVTAASWFLLGIWFGVGYCPITDWQWQIKEKLGESNLPASFIKYYADKITGRKIDTTVIDAITAGCFAGAALISIVVNFFFKKSAKKQKPRER